MLLVLFILWLVFNGRITLEIVLFGIVLSAAVYWFCVKFLGYSLRKDIETVKRIPMIIKYCGVLFIEIVKANAFVAKTILNKKRAEEISPVLVKFKTKLKTKTARFVLANSITLTPGTITVKLEGDEYVVHCLDGSLSMGLVDSVFERQLLKMEENIKMEDKGNES